MVLRPPSAVACRLAPTRTAFLPQGPSLSADCCVRSNSPLPSRPAPAPRPRPGRSRRGSRRPSTDPSQRPRPAGSHPPHDRTCHRRHAAGGGHSCILHSKHARACSVSPRGNSESSRGQPTVRAYTVGYIRVGSSYACTRFQTGGYYIYNTASVAVHVLGLIQGMIPLAAHYQRASRGTAWPGSRICTTRCTYSTLYL